MQERKLRNAQPEDIDALESLEGLCFPEEPWSRQMFIEELNNSLAFFAVIEDTAEAEDENTSLDVLGNTKRTQIIGYIIAWIIEPFECQIGSIAVHPKYRRQGLAEELIEALFQRCREASVDEAALEVRVNNYPAIALYEKFGFEKTGVRRHYYQDGEDAYNMLCTNIHISISAIDTK